MAGAIMTLSNPGTTGPVTDRLQTYFSKKLLVHALENLRLNEFAVQADLPKNSKSKTIRFFRKRAASLQDVETGSGTHIQTLSEGDPDLTTLTEVNVYKVETTLKQFGQLAKLSDVLTLIDAYEPLKMTIGTLGEDAALHCDTQTRGAIIGEKDAAFDDDTYSLKNTVEAAATLGQERFAGQGLVTDSATTFANLVAATNANSHLTRGRALGCVTQLKVNKAPKFGGNYVGLISPQVCHDLQQDDDWLDAVEYSAVDKLWNGEIGKIDGVRYVEATNPFTEDDVYLTENAATVDADTIYTSIYIGQGFFGCPKLAGTSSPMAPSVTILDKPEKYDPFNQFVNVAWKVFWASVVLNKRFGVTMRSKCGFNA